MPKLDEESRLLIDVEADAVVAVVEVIGVVLPRTLDWRDGTVRRAKGSILDRELRLVCSRSVCEPARPTDAERYLSASVAPE